MMKHLLLAAIGLIGCAALAKAQIFPTRPVSIIVTSAPGGAADATAPAVAGQLAKSWNQQVIVENKPGGNTQLAAEYVAKAAPHGHTLLLGPDVTFTVNPHLYLSYDPPQGAIGTPWVRRWVEHPAYMSPRRVGTQAVLL